ncbi:Kelch repeat-containing protein [Winogradskyella luteola]|uniref:Galactose oxidase n=1 Tax=Winogradskyella luteola TaxID=2828330 RepID=A0A9X1F5G0_9FLAO|nr:kelch repeat-containing protein [Winogradskyella luteola]MBV7267747.1 galactose oxidase [Winogradskyella luteola]
MKKQKINSKVLIIVCLFITSFYSCGDDDDDDDLIGNWAETSVFNEEPRSSATAFTIGNKGYMGTGFDGDDYFNDFWTYDFATNSWQQLADFSGQERSSAVAFTIGNTGYIGTGFNGDTNQELSDFYKYDVSANTWQQISDFGGTARYGSVGFGSDSYGYVGTGFDGDGDKKDFWKYDPTSDTWEELFGFGGSKRRDGVTFTIGSDVFLATGVSNGIYEDDFWVFNMNTETWSVLTDIDDDDSDDVIRANAVAFSLNGLGYIACGEVGGALGTVYEYNPNSDEWVERTSFERVARRDAVAFSNGQRAFVALGRNGTLYLDDNMEFFPTASQDDDDN